MQVLRTPDECFADIEGYAFAPHYTQVRGEDGTPIRIHHVEEGRRDAKVFPMDQMLPTGMTHGITPGEFAAYKAPFPDPSYEAGICEFPMLIAVQPDNPGVPANREAWQQLGRFEKPFLTLFGAKDPVTQGGEKRLQQHVPGASGQAHHVFPDASHFIQEDVPGELVARILDFIEARES